LCPHFPLNVTTHSRDQSRLPGRRANPGRAACLDRSLGRIPGGKAQRRSRRAACNLLQVARMVSGPRRARPDRRPVRRQPGSCNPARRNRRSILPHVPSWDPCPWVRFHLRVASRIPPLPCSPGLTPRVCRPRRRTRPSCERFLPLLLQECTSRARGPSGARLRRALFHQTPASSVPPMASEETTSAQLPSRRTISPTRQPISRATTGHLAVRRNTISSGLSLSVS